MTPTSSSKRRCGRGFTLLELLVVMSIVAIGIGLVVPNLAITDNSAFNAEVRNAASALTYARRMAIVKGAPQTTTLFALDPDASDYDERLAEVNALKSEARWVSEDQQLSFQNEVEPDPTSVDRLSVTFYPQGGSTGGRLGFSNDERFAMIRVDAITGRIDTAYNGEELDDEAQ